MLHTYLNGVNDDLKQLIEYTKQDIEDIQVANNEAIFSRTPIKDNLVKDFEMKKSLLHQEMLLLRDKNPQKQLADLLDEQANLLLDSMREQLKELKKLNGYYAKSVFAVSEFYNSLMQQIIPHENCGYDKEKPQSHLLQTKA